MKMTVKIKRRGRKPDPATFTKAAHERMKKLFRDATKDFLIEVINNVEVDTGMSAASLTPLAANVGLKTALLKSIAGKGPKRGHSGLVGKWASNNAQWKSKALGERLGEKAYEFDYGSAKAPIMRLVFEIVVFQYWLHELGIPAKTSGPWDSLEKGEQAFQAYVRKWWKQYLPDISVWLIQGRISGERI